MSDNDLISRADVLEALFDLLANSGWYERARDVIDLASAAPQEMTAREFVKEEQRMCGTYCLNGCYHCPLFDIFKKRCLAGLNKTTVDAVEKWAREYGGRTELAQNGGLSLGHSYTTITMPDSFGVLLDQHEQRQYEYEFPIRRPDGSEVDGKEEDDGES